jgi:hypothetical protein
MIGRDEATVWKPERLMKKKKMMMEVFGRFLVRVHRIDYSPSLFSLSLSLSLSLSVSDDSLSVFIVLFGESSKVSGFLLDNGQASVALTLLG